MTGDRTEFLGRNGTLASPAAMRRVRLSGRVGAGLDPCAAMQTPVRPGRRAGARDRLHPRRGRRRRRRRATCSSGSAAPAARGRRIEAVWHYWNRTLGAVHVETPDRGAQLAGQRLADLPDARLPAVGRSGFYQSGGAFGFRDQLQDAMALVHAEPLARPRAPAPLRGPPVPRGRRAALVASARRARRAHALLRRLSVAAVSPPAATSPATGDTGVLDETRPLPRGPRR